MAVLIKKNCDQQTLKVSRDLKKRKRNGERNNFKFHIGRLRGKYKQWRNGRDEQMVGKEVRPTLQRFTIKIFSSYVEKHDIS